MKHDSDSSNISKESISYALGYIEAKLAEIARDFNEPESEFREWVGILLLSSRQGINNRVSALSRKTSEVGKAMGALEMDEQPHRKTRRTHTPRKVAPSSKKGFKYNGTHWMQQPKNKKRVIAMMRARHAARAAKKAA